MNFHWEMAGHIPDSGLGLAGPVAGYSNGIFIVGGGSNFPEGAPWDGGSKAFYKKIYFFKKQQHKLSSKPETADLPYKVAYSANCSTKEGIVVAGGQNKEGALSHVLLLFWNKAADSLRITSLPDLPLPLSSGAITAMGKDIYFAGGQNASIVSDKLYHLNLKEPQKGWDTVSTLPYPVTHTVLYAAKKSLYLVGGRKRNIEATSTLYKTVYQYDLKEKKWMEETPLPYPLSAPTGITLDDTTLLVFSGDQGQTFHQTEVLITRIAKTKDTVVKNKLIKEKNDLQKHHPGFSGRVLAYNTQEKKWQNIDSIPFPGQVTTTAVKWGTAVFIPGGEIRAGVRTTNIIRGALK